MSSPTQCSLRLQINEPSRPEGRTMQKTRATGASVLIALGSLLAGLILLASPAGADPSSQTSGGSEAINGSVSSGTCLAVNGSVCSGSGVAANGSTSSGDAVAVNGSTGSGCATAINGSTASGGECAAAPMPLTPPHEQARPARPGAKVNSEATVAKPTAAKALAFTGSTTGPLAAAAAAALALGLVMVTLTSERRRTAHSS